MKKLMRSRKSRVLSGVLGGVAEHFNINANLLRVIFLLVMVLTKFFPLIVVYSVGIFFMKSEEIEDD